MRTTRLLLAAIALPVSLHAQDSTQTPRPRDSTLLEKLGLRGVQVSFGGGAAPYRGRATGTAGTAEFRLGFTPRSHSERDHHMQASGAQFIVNRLQDRHIKSSFEQRNIYPYHLRRAGQQRTSRMRWPEIELFYRLLHAL